MALISTTGPVCPNVVDTPLDNRSRVSTIAGIGNIPLAWKGMLVYCEENGITYKVTSLGPKRNGPVEIENYYPATWVEFGSGGSTPSPSPTPSYIDAGDIHYSSGGTFSNDTVGKELQSLANDILSLAEDIHILSGGINGVKQGNTLLTPDPDGIVTVTDFTSDINDIKNTLQQIANSEPIVVPSTAINLPTSGTFNYDSGNTYVMNVDSTQIATIHYPYTVGSTDYVAFKAIDRDLYYVYSVASNGITYTYSNQYTWSTLPAAAKSKFESGIYAVKQTINNDGSIPEGHWVHGVPSVFVTRHNYPLRYRQTAETVGGSPVYYILIKNDEINKIYKYQSSTQNGVDIWSQVTGGCYTKGDSTTGANYDKYDKLFDRHDASDVDFNNTNTGLNSTNTQNAIVEIYNKLGFEIKTTNTITNPTKNTYYDLTASAISALDITNVSISNTNEVIILFLASSSCTLTALATQRVLGSTAFADNTVYIMSIVRGVACIVEAPLYVVPQEEEQEEE